MKTIEQRARKTYPEIFDEENDEDINFLERQAYIKGAMDQQQIDIEKSWELFQKYATYIHPRKGVKTCMMTKYQFLEAMKG